MTARTTRRPRNMAGWPVSRLLAALSAAQWGRLGDRDSPHGMVAVLLALGRMLERYKRDRVGTLEATVGQVCDWSGYRPRWVAECLARLEAIGVLTWHRGGVVAGRPTPSVFMVSRRALADLVTEARPGAAVALQARSEATRARIQALRTGYVQSKSRRSRRSDHVAVPATLSPFGEVSTGHTPPMTAADGTLFGRWADIGTPGGGADRDDGPDGRQVGAEARASIRATLARARASAH